LNKKKNKVGIVGPRTARFSIHRDPAYGDRGGMKGGNQGKSIRELHKITCCLDNYAKSMGSEGSPESERRTKKTGGGVGPRGRG